MLQERLHVDPLNEYSNEKTLPLTYSTFTQWGWQSPFLHMNTFTSM